MSQLSTRHLLGIADLTEDDIRLIFDTADQFKEVLQRKIKKVPSLRDTTIANLFFENSTRTRVSFELAEKRLSADVVNFSASSSSTKKGETLIDTVNNILAMKVDVVVMRHPSPGAHILLARHIDARIVNVSATAPMSTPPRRCWTRIPCASGWVDLTGRRVVIIGDIAHSRVALSNILCLQALGAHVRVCGPPTLIPPHIESLGVEVSYDVDDSLDWCDVANVLRIQLERQDIRYIPSLREYTYAFGVTAARLARLRKEIVVMHPGPMNRGVEIDSDVADGRHAIILQQVENGVAIRMAVLYLLAGVIPGGGLIVVRALFSRNAQTPDPCFLSRGARGAAGPG